MDKIKLLDVPFEALHGVLKTEKERHNKFYVDLTADFDTRKAGANDSIGDTIDYTLLYESAKKVMLGPSKNLIEHLCSEIAEEILKININIKSVKVTIRKEYPLNCGLARYSAVTIKRDQQ